MSQSDQRLYRLSLLSWAIARLLRTWPLFLIAAFFLSPIGPYLRVSYIYEGSRDYPRYIACTYLGSRGFVPTYVPRCPIVAWLDSREHKQ